jgi:uncharacterized membrane protein
MTTPLSRRWFRPIGEIDADGPSQRHTLWLLVSIVLVGAALRIFHLGAEPLWADEAASWRFAHLTHQDLWGSVGRFETNPPLYYSLQRLSFVFGQSEAVLRSISALFGTLSIPIVYLIGRLVSGRAVGLIAAALIATSDMSLYFSQEARAYALLMTAALVAVWGLLYFLRSWSAAYLWPDSATAHEPGRAAPDTQRWAGLRLRIRHNRRSLQSQHSVSTASDS